MAQDQGGPPTIQPSDGVQDSGQREGSLETNFDLGNGGQPEDFPREVSVDGARFLFDRMVPATRQDLIPVAQDGPIQAFATTDVAPFDALYLSVPPRSEEELGRYLAEQIGASNIACPAEVGTFQPLDANGATYAFAGIEPLLTSADLEQVATDSNNQPVFADPGLSQPFPELFFTDPNGLIRFVSTTGAGVPVAISESLAIDGAQFAFQGDVTTQVDITSLTKIGCAGPFPVYSDADPASGIRYVVVGQQVFQYVSSGQVAVPTAPPATPIPSEVPSETPTATLEPSQTPSETPTQEPSATATETPTESHLLPPPRRQPKHHQRRRLRRRPKYRRPPRSRPWHQPKNQRRRRQKSRPRHRWPRSSRPLFRRPLRRPQPHLPPLRHRWKHRHPRVKRRPRRPCRQPGFPPPCLR